MGLVCHLCTKLSFSFLPTCSRLFHFPFMMERQVNLHQLIHFQQSLTSSHKLFRFSLFVLALGTSPMQRLYWSLLIWNLGPTIFFLTPLFHTFSFFIQWEDRSNCTTTSCLKLSYLNKLFLDDRRAQLWGHSFGNLQRKSFLGTATNGEAPVLSSSLILYDVRFQAPSGPVPVQQADSVQFLHEIPILLVSD